MHLSLTKDSVLALCHFLCHAGSGHGSNSVLDLTFYGGSVPVLFFVFFLLLEVVNVVLLHFHLFGGEKLYSPPDLLIKVSIFKSSNKEQCHVVALLVINMGSYGGYPKT